MADKMEQLTITQAREITRELARLLDKVGKANLPGRLGEDLLDGMRVWANANKKERCTACELGAIGDPRASGMECTCGGYHAK